MAFSDNPCQDEQTAIESSELLHMVDTAPLSESERKPNLDKQAVFDSVEALRTALASDTLTSQQPFQTFTSPFEVPAQQRNSGAARYVELPMIYCDQTASNRPVRSIERYMEQTCMPLYGNTHTNTSITGSQSTAFVAEARQIVAEATNAKITGKASLDVVLFAGNGATSAIELLIDCLGLKHAVADDRKNRPVVFVGPYEHHSNILPWRESGCEIVMVPECYETQTVDVLALERLLQSSQFATRLKMGAFSAASNVNGKVSDVNKICATLHRHGALAFVDYATGAPYISINMNPTPSESYPSSSEVALDAVFLSPHKMLGGVGTPGVLILKKHLVQQINSPKRSGGGTVFYVTNTHHRFLSNRIERYEGGTPNVSGILRTGLTFLLKRKSEERYAVLRDSSIRNGDSTESVPKSLLAYEFQTYTYVYERLKKVAPNLVMLGGNMSRGTHLPIFAFLIKCGKRFLHYNYVCAILNDVFGIQSRGGCQCAGPYSQRLLGLTAITSDGEEVPNERNLQIEHALVHYKERAELLRPGYSRLSLPFKGLREEEVNYVLKALEWVAKHGWALMCQYRCNHRTGEWRHSSRQGKPLGRSERKWLSHYNLFQSPSPSPPAGKSGLANGQKEMSALVILENALKNADAILKAARVDQKSITQALKMNDVEGVLGSDEDGFECLRWYMYPTEAAKWLSDGQTVVPETESDVLLGAINPATAYLSNQEQLGNPVDVGETRDGVDRLSPKRPIDLTQVEQEAKLVDELKVLNIVGRTGPEETIKGGAPPMFTFKEGEHTGEADLEDLAVGLQDGELCEHCEVFDGTVDGWVPLPTFLERIKNVKTDNLDIKASEPAKIAVEDKVGTLELIPSPPLNGNISICDLGESNAVVRTCLFSFKEGEHMVEAELEEIEIGLEDGELSENCKVFDETANGWVPLIAFLEKIQSAKTKQIDNKASGPVKIAVEHDVKYLELTRGPQSNGSGFIDHANQKKKPTRDSLTWGRGSFVQPKMSSTVSFDTVRSIKSEILHGKDDDQTFSDLSQPKAPRLNQEDIAVRKSKKGRGVVQPPKKMLRNITQAMRHFDMVEEGDRLLLGLSGGKDSLSLLHCLLAFQRKLPINFEIEVCTIDPMTPSFDPSPLIPYVESLGLKYHYIRDDIVARANSSGEDGKVVTSLCAFCARMKRGNLYTCARENNCNKLVLAQHLDDCAESFLMSVMHNGFLRTMKAHYKINSGDLSVIRPMVYCRESLMTEFAKTANLPVINENCPACFEEPKERARMKKLLSREENLYPHIHDNIRRSLIPLMHEDATAIMRCYTEEALSKSRKDQTNNKSDKVTKSRKNMILSHGKEDCAMSGEKKDQKMLHEADEDELVMELARRKADRFRLSGSMARRENGGDPTGQVCTLNGGNGTIPCRELME